MLTPDDIFAGKLPPKGRILIFDDDQIYLAGALAQDLVRKGYGVSFVTPASIVSPWTEHTLEQAKLQKDLMEHGVDIYTGQQLTHIDSDHCQTACIYTGRMVKLPCASTLLVTERQRHTALYDALKANTTSGIRTLELIGDAAAPGLIADAVYCGHRAARNFERDPDVIAQQDYAREIIDLTS